jgi:hypothetical protein
MRNQFARKCLATFSLSRPLRRKIQSPSRTPPLIQAGRSSVNACRHHGLRAVLARLYTVWSDRKRGAGERRSCRCDALNRCGVGRTTPCARGA